MRPARPVAALAAAAVVAMGAAGCSSGAAPTEQKKAPDQIYTDARSALGHASSVHVTGDLSSGGQPVHFDVRVKRGDVGDGTLTVEGVTLGIRRIGSKLYLRGNAAALSKFAPQASPQTIQRYVGKWLTASVSAAGLSTFSDFVTLSQLGQVLGQHGKLSKTGLVKIDGKQAVGLKDTTAGGTLYVQASGTSYPLQLKKTAAGNSGTLTFADYGSSVDVSAPPAGQVADLAELTG